MSSPDSPLPNAAAWQRSLCAAALASWRQRWKAAPDVTPRPPEELTSKDVQVLSSPQVFTWLASFSGAAPHVDLRQLLACDADALPLAGGLSLWRQPADVYLQLLRRSGPGSRGRDSKEAAFLAFRGPEFRAAQKGLETGLRLVQEHAAGYYEDLCRFTTAIALVDDRASFRGASGLAHRGLSYFGPDATWDPVVWAEELVHESTHNLLDVVGMRKPYLAGGGIFDEKYPAPLRPDMRHQYGNFQAVAVLSRLVPLLARLADDTALPGSWRSDAAVRRDNYLQAGRATLTTFGDREMFTDLGHAMAKAWIDPVLAPQDA